MHDFILIYLPLYYFFKKKKLTVIKNNMTNIPLMAKIRRTKFKWQMIFLANGNIGGKNPKMQS